MTIITYTILLMGINIMVFLIRWVGWLGILVNLYAIVNQQMYIFLVGQLISAIAAFMWAIWLQNKLTIDLILAVLLTVIAVITKNTFVMYSSMLMRSFSYQLQFERMVKQRNKT